MTTLEERRQLRHALLDLRFRKEGRTPAKAGAYSERWIRTHAGKVTDSIIIEWKAEKK